MELVKKISPKTVVGGMAVIQAALEESGGSELPLYYIIGMAMGQKSGSSEHGEWLALRGTFEARNMLDGSITNSALCFLPDVALDMVLGEAPSGDKAVSFAFEIGARKPKPGEMAPTGYVYTCKPYSEPGRADPLENMRKLLPPPKKTTEK